MATNWRYLAGAARARSVHWLLQRAPPSRVFPRGRVWQYDLRRFLRGRDPGVIFDVGANVGQTVVGLLGYFPRSDIYSFEPVPASIAVLKQRFGREPRLHLIEAALGDVAGVASINTHRDSERDTFLASALASGAIEVPVLALDGFCDEHGIAAIDILKMDVQGWELEVLRGANRMLSEQRINFVFGEVGFAASGGDAQPFSAFHAYMTEERGFIFSGLYDQYRYGPEKQFVSFGNALYCNPNFVRRAPLSPA